VGSAIFTGNNNNPRGIFTTEKGDVTVYAGGDINLNGSRIATYDGGDVTVESFDGNVDCGSGSSGYVVVQKFSVDPITHAVISASATIPGSGILATTFPLPDSYNTVGDIFVDTPNGNIIANAGGIVQLPLNHVKSPNATVTLLAGYELGNEQPVSPGRDIDVSGSGVIAQNASLKASGSINGLIFAEGNIDINAQQNVNVTVLAQGTASVGAGGNVSGTIIGVGGISASGGGGVDAALISNNSISGTTSGQSGTTQGTAANATSAAASSDNANETAKNSTTTDNGDDEQKKKKAISLAQRVSRVTVLLPVKN